MNPRLILLTGPSADEVVEVFRALANPPAFTSPSFEVDGCPWDEVRDYLEAPRCISDLFCGARTVTPEGIRAASRRQQSMARSICALPGGEEWLVGLVLPEYVPGAVPGWHQKPLGLENMTWKHAGPARLAILAPDAPALLVERVKAWGGEVWECGISAAPDTVGDCLVTVRTACHYAKTWPEAVRAALGET